MLGVLSVDEHIARRRSEQPIVILMSRGWYVTLAPRMCLLERS